MLRVIAGAFPVEAAVDDNDYIVGLGGGGVLGLMDHAPFNEVGKDHTVP